jgi:hypothetical protein
MSSTVETQEVIAAGHRSQDGHDGQRGHYGGQWGHDGHNTGWDSVYKFTFYEKDDHDSHTTYNGDPRKSDDWYTGWTVGDSSLYKAGDVIETKFGYYKIEHETEYKHDLSEKNGAAYEDGVVYTELYYDAYFDRLWETYNYQSPAISGHGGLGTEMDSVWEGPYTTFGQFGHGGQYLINDF